MMPILAIYVIAFIAYIAYSRRRQAKAQEDRFSGLAKGAEVETIGGLIAIVDEVDKENNRIVLDAEGVFLQGHCFLFFSIAAAIYIIRYKMHSFLNDFKN